MNTSFKHFVIHLYKQLLAWVKIGFLTCEGGRAGVRWSSLRGQYFWEREIQFNSLQASHIHSCNIWDPDWIQPLLEWERRLKELFWVFFYCEKPTVSPFADVIRGNVALMEHYKGWGEVFFSQRSGLALSRGVKPSSIMHLEQICFMSIQVFQHQKLRYIKKWPWSHLINLI